MPRIDTEVKRWVSGGNASPPERMKSPGKHAWRGVSGKYCRNKMERGEGGMRGEWRDQRPSSKRKTGACRCCGQGVTWGIVMSQSSLALRVSSGEYGSKYMFYGSRRPQKERV